MKKFFVLFLLSTMSIFSLFAQEEQSVEEIEDDKFQWFAEDSVLTLKNKIQVGGRGAYHSKAIDNSQAGQGYDQNENFLEFSPRVGYFFNEKMSAGVVFNYKNSSEQGNDLSGGLYMRNHHKVGKSTYIFEEPSILFGNRSYYLRSEENFGPASSVFPSNMYFITKEKFNETYWSVGLNMGIIHWFSNKFALEMAYGQIGYHSGTLKGDDSEAGNTAVTLSNNEFVFDFNFSTLKLGGMFFF